MGHVERFEGGDVVMVILVGERDGMGYMEYKGLKLVLCLETCSQTVKELFHLL